MKIVKAERIGEVSVVSVLMNGVTVSIERIGDVSQVKASGRGNVRFCKAQAKLLHGLLWS